MNGWQAGTSVVRPIAFSFAQGLEQVYCSTGRMGMDLGRVKASSFEPVFLGVTPGDVVVVWDHPELVGSDADAWWMGEVICTEGSARNPQAPSLFQVADVDSGVIRWVNADCVQRVCLPIKSPLTKLTELDGSGPPCSASWALS